ncbi:hypothetical protein RHSP_49317 [Rhizobium freirei PRF 81]|uniref:Uncharacterized protein n=1 Tax=Rhizobium freirei PRF 81 TaxID=363754 RepID=N6U5N1_9HYPH|nr:hypothetical protein RHSP_49317 [Rhizobium freirei PRF 81]
MRALYQQKRRPRRAAFSCHYRGYSVSAGLGIDGTLGEVDQHREDQQEHYDHEAEVLAIFQMRLGCPHQEGGHIARILIDRLRRAVVIGHLAVRKRLRHGKSRGRIEIRVVVRVLRHLEAGRRFFIAGQQRVDIVRAAFLVLGEDIEDELREAAFDFARLGKQRHIRRHSPVVGSSSSLVVRERRVEMVRRNCLASEHLTLGVRPVLHFVVGCKGLHLGFRIAEIAQRTVGHQLHRVAGGTDFRIDLEAALKLRLVIVAERAGEGPMLLARLLQRIMRRLGFCGRLRFRRNGGNGGRTADERKRQKADNKFLHRFLPLSPVMPEPERQLYRPASQEPLP